jgi:hypothetical protein
VWWINFSSALVGREGALDDWISNMSKVIRDGGVVVLVKYSSVWFNGEFFVIVSLHCLVWVNLEGDGWRLRECCFNGRKS